MAMAAGGGREVVAHAEAVLLDCDGVLWRGEQLLPGADRAVALLRAQGKKVIFVTNNATKSRLQCTHKLQSKGIPAQPEEVYCSAYAAAAYLRRLNFSKKAFVVGMAGIEDELAAQGIPFTGGLSYPCAAIPLEEAAGVALDPSIGAVVAGLDPRFCYAKLAHAVALLQGSADCLFVATNSDSALNAANGRLIPGAGSIIAAIEKASGKTAVVVGKPNSLMLDIIVSEHSLDRSRTVMVGDRLDTDILFGHRGGLRTLLVLSGVTTWQTLARHREQPGAVLPDAVLDSLADLLPPEGEGEGEGGEGGEGEEDE